MSAESSAIRLRSLGNQPPPPELAADLRLLLGFPTVVISRWWALLGPCLEDPIPAKVAGALDEVARVHAIDGDALARALRASRVLVRGAALLDLDAKALADDADRLTGPEPIVGKLLALGYDAAKRMVREAAIRSTLARHGRVLDGFDWRVEQVLSSSSGGQLRFPMVAMTLYFTEGGKKEEVTAQLTLERLRELQILGEQLLGPVR